jgi:predicted enzyme related to lactoylglutathione lyase
VVFATTPIPLAVREPLPGVNLDAAGRARCRLALWLKADDTQALHDRLAAAGVLIVSAPADGRFGCQFAFADPGGYVITVHDHA